MPDAVGGGRRPAPGWSAAWYAVTASAVAAIAVHAAAVAAHHAWPWPHAAMFGLGALAGRFASGAWLGLLLGAGALVAPAAAPLGLAAPHLSISAVAGVLGWVMARRVGTAGWALPTAWRWPMATWALVVAATWPAVAGRELDWSGAAWPSPAQNYVGGPTPADTVALIAAAAAAQLTALLLLEGLVRAGTTGGRPPASAAGWPFGAVLGVSVAAALYQVGVDITWLNTPYWIEFRRAPGLVGDPNVLGAVAALVGPAVATAAWPRRGRARWLAAAAIGLALAGVVASGSRTALAGWALGSSGLLVAAIAGSRRPVHAWFGALAALGIVAALAVALARSDGTNALTRAVRALADTDLVTVEGVRAAVVDRYGYGPAAEAVIGDHRWWGVGIGTGDLFLAEYSTTRLSLPIIPDNAQNWWRQVVVDLGLAGGAAALAASLVVFVTLMATWRVDGVSRMLARTAPVVAAGVMLLVSVPTQHPLVQLAMAWLLALAAAPEGRPPLDTAAPRRSPWLPAAAAVLAVIGLTASVARPPERAQAANRSWGYGNVPVPPPPGTVWVGPHAVGVVPARSRRYEVVASLPHSDLAVAPVNLTISDRGSQVCRTRVETAVPVTCGFTLAPGLPAVMVQVDVSRGWPSAEGARGALIEVRFLPEDRADQRR